MFWNTSGKNVFSCISTQLKLSVLPPYHIDSHIRAKEFYLIWKKNKTLEFSSFVLYHICPNPTSPLSTEATEGLLSQPFPVYSVEMVASSCHFLFPFSCAIVASSPPSQTLKIHTTIILDHNNIQVRQMLGVSYLTEPLYLFGWLNKLQKLRSSKSLNHVAG